MRKLIVIIIISLFIFAGKNKYVLAQNWYYPLEKSIERITVKNFGIFVDKNFYIGKESLFPYNRFYGYHAGVDLETFPEEQTTLIPFYAIYPGVITFAGPVNGYGGVVLEKLDDNSHVALYGHVQIKNLKIKLGERVESKQLIGYLGEAFTTDSGRERKHLHFALHKGTDNFFLGHENTLTSLNRNWENPMEFLKNHEAASPVTTITEIPTPTIAVENSSGQSPTNLLQKLLDSIKQWFSNIKAKIIF